VYKAIFIDIDDTLLDYIPCCREAFDAAMTSLSGVAGLSVERSVSANDLSVEDDLFQIFFQISGRLFSEAKHGLHTIAEVMELYPKEFIATIGYPESAVDPFKHAFRAAWGKTHTLVSGARETLEALRNKGYRLFAASNSFGHLQRSRLEQAGILSFFEDTYISMDIGYDKPDIRFYQEALRRCGLPPQDVLMIGDSMTTDILGARQAGLDVLFFNRRNEPLDPSLDLPSITSLPEILQFV
jgi:HAD superfamily hydrolase (TIGR01549 family)